MSASSDARRAIADRRSRDLVPEPVGSAEPTFEYVPPFSESDGPFALDLAAECGIDADPWQRHVTWRALAADPVRPSTWASREVAIIVPRQNGKGTCGEIRVLAGLELFDERLIIWTSHLLRTANEAKDRIVEAIEANDDLKGSICKIHKSHGSEEIELYGLDRSSRLTEKRRVLFMARSKHSGRGFAGADALFYDEAYGLTPEEIAATVPTMATKPRCQIWYLSSPPLDTADADATGTGVKVQGSHLYRLRRRAHSDSPGRLSYFEWSIPENLDECVEITDGRPRIDVSDRGLWYATNPSLGHRLQVDAVEMESGALGPREFARERLGAWPPIPADLSQEDTVFDIQTWASSKCFERHDAPVAIGIDAQPSGSSATMVAVYEAHGQGHVELIDSRPGVSWIPEAMDELRREWNPVVFAYDEKSRIAVIRRELERIRFTNPRDRVKPGVDQHAIARRGELFTLDLDDAVMAAADLRSSVNEGNECHRDDPMLNIAASGVLMRSVGDGREAFGRRVSGTDISPIVAWANAKLALKLRSRLVSTTYRASRGIR